jgi:hypothetical protein
MKHTFVFAVAAFSIFGVGCAASHDAFYASDPTTSVQFECTRAPNGARHCVRRIESTVPGGAAMYGGGYSPELYGGYGQVAHPRIVMVPRGPQLTEAERAMEDIPGGVVLLHPSDEEYATKEDLAIVVRQTAITKKEVKELKKKGGQKQPSSSEAAQH